MVKFTMEQVRAIMEQQQNIRNISVIAHVDHGKSTLTDALVHRAGIISEKEAGNKRWTDGRPDQQEMGITIKSTGVSMYYTYDITNSEKEDVYQEYLVNLIDSPGHVDFSSQVTAALRVTDGALVVVDAVEGVCVQTETVLRQAMQERIKPVLMINKVDRCILELKLDGEEIYQKFIKVIDNVNVIISTYQNQQMGELICEPNIGNVVFGAGKDQWAFTLNNFARYFAKKLGISSQKMMKRLWGDHFYDPVVKKWKNTPEGQNGNILKRGFVQFIMDPICELSRAIMSADVQTYSKMLDSLQIKLSFEEKGYTDKKLLKTVLSKWMPAADCLLETIILHLPSPAKAQQYRTEYLYQGPIDDQCATAMKKCDPNGPLMVYISKMVPQGGRFYAFGRIFSGTVTPGQKVQILNPNYKFGDKTNIHCKAIQRVAMPMGKTFAAISDVPCGNVVAISGIDEYLLKTGTLTSIEISQPYPLRSMKYSVAPVFRVAVQPKNPAQLPKLVQGMKKLSISDPLIVCSVQQTGEMVVAGSGELHLEICLKDLRQYAKCEILQSDPIVTYKQTILSKSEEIAMVKSANKLNRFYGNSQPLHSDLVAEIEKGEINMNTDHKIRSKRLTQEFDWDKNDTVKIWSFGPEDIGPNILVDTTKGVQYMNEVSDSLITAFQWASKQGVLAEETLRGVRFNIVDSNIHVDPAHRGGGQVIPSGRRLFQGLELLSHPTLLEPIFMCEITVPPQAIGGVYQTLNSRRGCIIDQIQVQGTPMSIIKAELPVAESFGFVSALRGNTQGQAFPQCYFDHWQAIKGDPFQDEKAAQLVLNIRKRKGLKEELPRINDYLDKL